MKLSAQTRRRLLAQARRSLGEDGVQRWRVRGITAARCMRGLRARVSRLSRCWLKSPRLRVSLAIKLNEHTCLVAGRMDTSLPFAGLSAEFDPHQTLDLTTALQCFDHRYQHAPNAQGPTRFAVLVERQAHQERIGAGFTLQVQDTAGRAAATRVDCRQRHSENTLAQVRKVLALLPSRMQDRTAVLHSVVGPSVKHLWQGELARRANLGAAGETLVHHNPQRASIMPDVTVIVPIYGRHDYMAHQLVSFAADADFARGQLLYVIDDPRLQAAVRVEAERLARLHDLAFSILYLPHNLGYAGANNAAARYAQGKRLLLLNSDVFPQGRGWLGQLIAHADRLGDGLLGARLLYHDGTVQHDGMRFEPSRGYQGLWINRHPGKGLCASLFIESSTVVAREAVTGACLLIDRTLYHSLGGFDEGYIRGDFEDSDLCLKARQRGHPVHLATDVALLHLERQSLSLASADRWKADLTHYNCWRHHQRWDAVIETLKTNTPWRVAA